MAVNPLFSAKATAIGDRIAIADDTDVLMFNFGRLSVGSWRREY
jgi:hypothetical protein